MTMDRIETQDLMPVRSRVSWPAIFAGAVVALAFYFLLSCLGVALGFTVSHSVGERELGIGAAIWAVAALLVALFVGGLTASQVSVGENRTEAMFYGLLVWGVVFGALLLFAGSGMRMGFNAMMGIAASPTTAVVVNQLDAEDMRQAGLNPEQIERLQARARNLPEELRARAQDPRMTQAAWWTLLGIVASMGAAIFGALAGAGPEFVFRRHAPVGTVQVTQARTQETVVR